MSAPTRGLLGAPRGEGSSKLSYSHPGQGWMLNGDAGSKELNGRVTKLLKDSRSVDNRWSPVLRGEPPSGPSSLKALTGIHSTVPSDFKIYHQLKQSGFAQGLKRDE